MANPEELAALSLTIARHELTEMRARLFDASAGNQQVVRSASEIVKQTDPDATATSPEHLAFALLAEVYKEITERAKARTSRLSSGPD